VCEGVNWRNIAVANWLLDRLWQEWKQIESDVQAITDEIECISNEDARCLQLR
jgi:hypothetical protein